MQATSNKPLRMAAFDLRISLSFPVKRSCVILVQAARPRYCEYPQCYWWDIAAQRLEDTEYQVHEAPDKYFNEMRRHYP